MDKKKIGFVLFLIIGNVVVGLSSFRYLGADATIALIAFFTSLSTAVYSIMNEPKKPQPLLRVKPSLRNPFLGSLGLDLYIDNVGDSSAKDIKVICKTSPEALTLENNGLYNIEILPSKERPVQIIVITSIETPSIESKKVEMEVTYSNMDNEKQKAIKKIYDVKILLDDFHNRMYKKMG